MVLLPKLMAKPHFRPYKGKWLLKDYILDTTVAVTKGDLLEIETEGLDVLELATSDAACIVGIAAKDYPSQTPDTDIKVWVPAEMKSEMIGDINSGVAVVDEDINRPCDVYTHEGAAVDAHAHDHLFLVRTTIATADGTTATGEGIFRIVQTPEFMGTF